MTRILPIGCRGGDWIFGVGGGNSDEKQKTTEAPAAHAAAAPASGSAGRLEKYDCHHFFICTPAMQRSLSSGSENARSES